MKVRLSRDWTRHQVVVSKGRDALRIASRRTLAPLLDPTYDQLELWADAAWACALGAALGRVTGLGVDLPDDL